MPRSIRGWPVPEVATAEGRSLLIGATVIVALVLLALVAPWLAPYPPDEQPDPAGARGRAPGTRLFEVRLVDDRTFFADRVERTGNGLRFERLGSWQELSAAEVSNLATHGVAHQRHFLLGTDRFGRDVASRVLYGLRLSLLVGLLATLMSTLVGVAVGSLAAFGPRIVDSLLMRVVDGLLAFPVLFLVLTLNALLRPSTWLMVVVLAATSWMGTARLVRAEIRSTRQRTFVLAAEGLGLPPWRVLLVHVLPNALGPVVATFAAVAASVILTESALSFLGLGVQPPAASLGSIIQDGRESLREAWWVAAIPGALIAILGMALNLVGDGLRDRLDPRLSSVRDSA